MKTSLSNAALTALILIGNSAFAELITFSVESSGQVSYYQGGTSFVSMGDINSTGGSGILNTTTGEFIMTNNINTHLYNGVSPGSIQTTTENTISNALGSYVLSDTSIISTACVQTAGPADYCPTQGVNLGVREEWEALFGVDPSGGTLGDGSGSNIVWDIDSIGDLTTIDAIHQDGGIYHTLTYTLEVTGIEPSAVPLPAAAWFFLTALGGLGLIKQRTNRK